MSTRAEPCPSCGKRPWLAHYEDEYAVYCGNPRCDHEDHSGDWPTRDEAVERWNLQIREPQPLPEPQPALAAEASWAQW
jgi:hypothetical protein